MGFLGLLGSSISVGNTINQQKNQNFCRKIVIDLKNALSVMFHMELEKSKIDAKNGCQ